MRTWMAATAFACGLFAFATAFASEADLIHVYQVCSDGNGGLHVVRMPCLAYDRGSSYRLVRRTCDSSRVWTPWGWDSGNVLCDAGVRIRPIDLVRYTRPDSTAFTRYENPNTDTLFVELDARNVPNTYVEMYTTGLLVKMAVECAAYNAAATVPTPKTLRMTVLGPPEVRKFSKDYRVANYRLGPPK